MNHKSLEEIIREGTWEKLKNHPEYQALSYHRKIIVAKNAISTKLAEADSIFRETVRDDIQSAGIIHEKLIRPLRDLKKALNACYARDLNQDEEEVLNSLLGIASPSESQE